MISADHVRLMAKYNRWQNGSVYGAAELLSEEQRQADKGAFFGSIHATLNHILWADQMWMHRFAGSPRPEPAGIEDSRTYYSSWEDLRRERATFDSAIGDWAKNLSDDWLIGDLTWYSSSLHSEIIRPRWMLVTHMFNHQTHHRGQVHCLLTGFGVQPEDTDLPFMPELDNGG